MGYALGLALDLKTDSFYFAGVDLNFVVSTKRACLSITAKLFDPLGVLSPFIMYNKIILQYLWRLNLDWDDVMPPELNNKFQLWLASTNILKSWKIGRCYFPMCKWSSIESIEVHGFCDSPC